MWISNREIRQETFPVCILLGRPVHGTMRAFKMQWRGANLYPKVLQRGTRIKLVKYRHVKKRQRLDCVSPRLAVGESSRNNLTFTFFDMSVSPSQRYKCARECYYLCHCHITLIFFCYNSKSY